MSAKLTVQMKTFNVIIRRNGKLLRCFDRHAVAERDVVEDVAAHEYVEPDDTITIGEVTRTVQDEHAYVVTEDGIVEEKQ